MWLLSHSGAMLSDFSVLDLFSERSFLYGNGAMVDSSDIRLYVQNEKEYLFPHAQSGLIVSGFDDWCASDRCQL